MDQVNVQSVEDAEIDLKELAMVLFGKAWIILLAGVLAAIFGFAYTQFMVTPLYQSTSTVYIINKQGEGSMTSSDISSATNLVKDFAVLAVEQGILDNVIEALGLDMTAGQLKSSISVSNPDGTRILKFTVSNADPELAKQIVDELVTTSASHLKEVMNLAEVNVSNEGSVAKNPYNISTKRNVVLGFLLGAFLACAVILVLYFLDDTFKAPEDVEKYLGLSTLGILPELSAAGRSTKYSGRHE